MHTAIPAECGVHEQAVEHCCIEQTIVMSSNYPTLPSHTISAIRHQPHSACLASCAFLPKEEEKSKVAFDPTKAGAEVVCSQSASQSAGGRAVAWHPTGSTIGRKPFPTFVQAMASLRQLDVGYGNSNSVLTFSTAFQSQFPCLHAIPAQLPRLDPAILLAR